MDNSNFVTINKCCAICEHLWDKNVCPLYETYNAACEVGQETFDEWVKYRTCCDTQFELHKLFRTYTQANTPREETSLNGLL